MTNNMKQVIIYELDETLSEHREYLRTEIHEILGRMHIKAHKMGYKDITFKFKSTREPYEDDLGSPIVRACGWMDKTEQDLEVEAAEKKQRDLAKELGCTYYEAGQYLMLKKKGVIK